MLHGLTSRRELAAGALMLLFGLVAVLEGRRLGVGSLSEMGPGFIPLTLGLALCGLGLIIAFSGGGADDEPDSGPPDWRGATCIVLGAISFIALGTFAGLIPAIFASVFIAAIGDRTTSLIGATVLAACVTLFGCLLFAMVLKIPIPLIQGLN